MVCKIFFCFEFPDIPGNAKHFTFQANAVRATMTTILEKMQEKGESLLGEWLRNNNDQYKSRSSRPDVFRRKIVLKNL